MDTTGNKLSSSLLCTDHYFGGTYSLPTSVSPLKKLKVILNVVVERVGNMAGECKNFYQAVII